MLKKIDFSDDKKVVNLAWGNKRYLLSDDLDFVCLFVCNRGDTILHHGGLHTNLNQCNQGS